MARAGGDRVKGGKASTRHEVPMLSLALGGKTRIQPLRNSRGCRMAVIARAEPLNRRVDPDTGGALRAEYRAVMDKRALTESKPNEGVTPAHRRLN